MFTDKAQRIFAKYSKKDTLYFTSDGQAFFDKNSADNTAAALGNKKVSVVTRESLHAPEPEVEAEPAPAASLPSMPEPEPTPVPPVAAEPAAEPAAQPEPAAEPVAKVK